MSLDSVFLRRESAGLSISETFPFRVTFTKAEGSLMWDSHGKEYIDFFTSAGSLNYGHNPIPVREKLIDYLTEGFILNGLDFYTDAKKEFMLALEKEILVPRNLPHRIMFNGPTGTNSIEFALKLAKLATKRNHIAAFTNGFHGMTLGALAVTGNDYNRRASGSTLNDVDRYPFDDYYGNAIDTISMIDQLLEDQSSGYEPPAAFLLEVVQGEGGIHVASIPWLQKLSRLAKKYGSLLIVDEIQAGCGRTGHFFSFDDADITPDIICLSKSISGYGLPMAITLVAPEFDIMTLGQHSGTFRGNSLAFVAATETLKLWQDKDFLQTIARNSHTITEGLAHLQQKLQNHSSGFSIRGKGMMHGLVCPSEPIAATIAHRSFDNGLVIERCGPDREVVKLLPAINIPTDTLINGLNILSECALSAASQY